MIRGEKVMLDRDLARLYDVSTAAFNQAVRRNRERFPEDFMFQLASAEVAQLNRSQSVIGSEKHRDLYPLQSRSLGQKNDRFCHRFTLWFYGRQHDVTCFAAHHNRHMQVASGRDAVRKLDDYLSKSQERREAGHELYRQLMS